MDFTRRSFIGFLGIGLSVLSKPTAANEFVEDTRLPVLQGATDDTTSQFSVISNKSDKVVFEYFALGSKKKNRIADVRFVQQSFSPWAVSQFWITGLKPDTRYILHIRSAGGALLDEREFKTLSPAKKPFKFAFLSCMNDHLYTETIWRTLEKQNVDQIFMIGDSVYADFISLIGRKDADLKQMWERTVKARQTLYYYKARKLTPTIAVWDDHDFGKNNGDRTFAHKNDAEFVFNLFFAQKKNSALKKGPGISSVFEWADQRFLLLDGRSFRSPVGDKSEPAYFGDELEAWTLDQLNAANKPTWLISGTQWFGGYRSKEGFEFAHPELFRKFLNSVRTAVSKVLFVSGDIHMSEVMRVEREALDYTTYEITSSGMHSFTGFGFNDRKFNPRRLVSYNHKNFNMVEAKVEGERLVADVACLKATGRTAYSIKLEV